MINWYYEQNGEQNGPITEAALKRLLQDGAITIDSLIWRDGLKDWVPFRDVFPDTEVDSSALVACPNCGAMVSPDALIPAGDATVCPNCREEYLQRIKEGVSIHADSDALEIREAHIKHEASVKSIGLLYFLGAFFTLFGGLAVMIGMAGASGGGGEPEMAGFMIGMVVFYIVIGILMILIGRGYRKLKKWVRIPGTIFSGLGLLSFPIGTLINGYILYLLWSQKGKMVFSVEYQDVIAATPDVKYKTSPIVIGLLVLIVIFLLIGIGAAAAGA